MQIQALLVVGGGLLFCAPVFSQQNQIKTEAPQQTVSDDTDKKIVPGDSAKAKQYIESNWPEIEAKLKAEEEQRLKREAKKQNYEKRWLALKASMIEAGATPKEADEILKTARKNIRMSAWPLWVKKQKFESKTAWRVVSSSTRLPFRSCRPGGVKINGVWSKPRPQPVYVVVIISAQSPFQLLDKQWKPQNATRIQTSTVSR